MPDVNPDGHVHLVAEINSRLPEGMDFLEAGLDREMQASAGIINAFGQRRRFIIAAGLLQTLFKSSLEFRIQILPIL